MPAKTIMIQGTASSVGKSILVAALCRIFKQDGYKVTPFKAQNMSNNSFVTRENAEIGRAQAVQAEAADIEPSVYMNPILIKPEADNRSQIVVMGMAQKTLNAEDYYKYTPELLKYIESALHKLRSEYEIVVIEGAGSPAEINLKEREIVNMRVARMLNSPVCMVGDIDRGGVFASIVGTLQLLDKKERNLIKGIIINKFRGDQELLKPGLLELEKITGKPVLGVIPYKRGLNIAQEDAVYLEDYEGKDSDSINIAVIYLPHISNYDDFDPLEKYGCNVIYVKNINQLDHPDMIIIPGTKSTVADLQYLRDNGLEKRIIKLVKRGTPVLGVCGGFQMLCHTILDPHNTESPMSRIRGMGLLKCTTQFAEQKHTVQVKAIVSAKKGLMSTLQGKEISGYEIHMGESENSTHIPAFQILATSAGDASYYDGAIDITGNIIGTYIHGLFHNHQFTRGFVNQIRLRRNLPLIADKHYDKQKYYDELADLVRRNIDMPKIYQIVNIH